MAGSLDVVGLEIIPLTFLSMAADGSEDGEFNKSCKLFFLCGMMRGRLFLTGESEFNKLMIEARCGRTDDGILENPDT